MVYLKSDSIALCILVSIQSRCGIFYNVYCFYMYRAKKVQERSFRINYRRQSNNINTAFGCSSKSCGVETNADLHV